MREKVILTLVRVVVCYLWCAVPSVMGRSFTLSDDDLMSLDSYVNNADPNSPSVPKIVSKRDVPGPGVEFDIYFPKDNKKNNSVGYVSCKYRGAGTLVDVNIQDYNSFALKFTLVSVDGNSTPNTGGLLVVGALVNTGYSWAYRPEVIGFVQDESATAVSITETDADKISIIGFEIHKLTPNGWNPEGTTITVRIEPAPDAEIPP